MKNFCEEIINQSINPKNINFLFKTLTKSIKRTNDLWEIEVNNGMKKTLYGFELEKADESLQFIKVKPSAESIGILAIKNYKKWLVEDLTKAKLNYITNLKIN